MYQSTYLCDRDISLYRTASWVPAGFFIERFHCISILPSCVVLILFLLLRLLQIAPVYYNMVNFPECEAKRQLAKLKAKLEARMQ